MNQKIDQADTWGKWEGFERLNIFRRVFAFTFLCYMLVWAQSGREWLTTDSFHLTRQTNYRNQIDPFPRLPITLLTPFAVLLFAATLCVILNHWNIPALTIVVICAVYVDNADPISSFSINKLYVATFFLLLIERIFSKIALGDGVQMAVAHGLYLTPLVQYLAAGLCKMINGDWLHCPDVLWTQVQGLYCTNLCAWLLRILPAWAWAAVAWFGLLFELSAPLLFMVRKLRPWGVVAGILFHIGIALLMLKLWLFSIQMLSYYVLLSGDMLCKKTQHPQHQ